MARRPDVRVGRPRHATPSTARNPRGGARDARARGPGRHGRHEERDRLPGRGRPRQHDRLDLRRPEAGRRPRLEDRQDRVRRRVPQPRAVPARPAAGRPRRRRCPRRSLERRGRRPGTTRDGGSFRYVGAAVEQSRSRMEQAINEIGPHLVKFRGVDGFWHGPARDRARSPATVVLGLLAQVEQKNQNERLRVVRFLIQAEWYPEAKRRARRPGPRLPRRSARRSPRARASVVAGRGGPAPRRDRRSAAGPSSRRGRGRC